MIALFNSDQRVIVTSPPKTITYHYLLTITTIDSYIPYKRFLVNNALIMQWERNSDVTDATGNNVI